MAILISGIVLQGLNAENNAEDALALRRVKNLLSRTENMLPGSRGFGMNDDYLDEPPEEFQDDFAMDLYDKVDKYIKNVDIQDIEWQELESRPGVYKVLITLERKNE